MPIRTKLRRYITQEAFHHIEAMCLLFVFISTMSLSAVADNFRLRAHQTNQNVDLNDLTAEIQFGRDIAARILGRTRLLEDVKLTQYVNLVGQALVMHANRPELKYHFAVLDSQEINAYSTPGGYIFVTSEAIRHMQDESELAGVLAHEIAHVNRRHIVKQLKIYGKSKSSLFSSLTMMLSGSNDTAKVAFSQIVDQAVNILFDQGYKIKDELEADSVGTLLLANSGYDPLALQRYLKRIDSFSKTRAKVVNKTHPSSTERMSVLSQLIEDEKLTLLGYPHYHERFNHYVHFE